MIHRWDTISIISLSVTDFWSQHNRCTLYRSSPAQCGPAAPDSSSFFPPNLSPYRHTRTPRLVSTASYYRSTARRDCRTWSVQAASPWQQSLKQRCDGATANGIAPTTVMRRQIGAASAATMRLWRSALERVYISIWRSISRVNLISLTIGHRRSSAV